MAEKQVQKKELNSEKPELEQYGDYIVLPTLIVTREPFPTKGQNQRELWSYVVKVSFYGQEKQVGLQTPNSDEFGSFNKDKRDKYGYQILDAMFDVLGTVPLAIKFIKTSSGALRDVEYYAVGFETVGGAKVLVDHIQLVTKKTSSESLLRSAINRLALANGWNLPTL